MIKKLFFPFFILGIIFSATLAVAEEAPKPNCPPPPEENDEPPPPPPNIRKVSKEELQMLRTLFSMSNKELARIREMITRLEHTPEAKRKKMAEDLERATSDDPAVRQKFMDEMRSRFEARRKNLLERYYSTLPPDQAKKEAEAFLKMSKREQFEYMRNVREKLGIPPPPDKKKSKKR